MLIVVGTRGQCDSPLAVEQMGIRCIDALHTVIRLMNRRDRAANKSKNNELLLESKLNLNLNISSKHSKTHLAFKSNK